MLLSKFNNGLLKPIKNRICYLEGKITNFDDDLRVAGRKIEVELAVQNANNVVKLKSGDTKSMKCRTKMTKATADTGDIGPSLVCSLQSRVEELEHKKVHHKPNIRTQSYSNSNNFYRQPSAHQRSFHHQSSFHQQSSSFNRQSSSQMPFDMTHIQW